MRCRYLSPHRREVPESALVKGDGVVLRRADRHVRYPFVALRPAQHELVLRPGLQILQGEAVGLLKKRDWGLLLLSCQFFSSLFSDFPWNLFFGRRWHLFLFCNHRFSPQSH